MDTAKLYATELANTLTKITMVEFFKEIQSLCYPEQDISFMDYFLELTEHEGECVVPHTKLLEYGIMTSKRSNDIKDKLDLLQLENEVDYLLRDVSQQLESGAKHSKHYYLTPEAFKKCLMRAQRRPNQTVDPVIYCDYYLLLEKIYKLYTDYERQYSDQLLAQKDDNIDKLSASIDKMGIQLDIQNAKIDQLLAFGNKLVGQNDKLQLSVDMTHEELGASLNYLMEKTHNTNDPVNDAKVTHFTILAPNTEHNEGRTILVRGPAKRIDKTVQLHAKTHSVIVATTYNANSINLIVNAKASYDKMVRAYIIEYNEPIRVFNEQLKVEIFAHNKMLKQLTKSKTPTGMVKRHFPNEKKDLLCLSHIPITFATTTIWYLNNPHFSYQSIIQIILDLNKTIQKSPTTTDNNSE